MDLVEQVAELRQRVATWRRSGARVAFVPTMGNLHLGHLTLMRVARAQADRTVASIFVNPLQFGPHEDFAAYPRAFERDRAMLAAEGTDLLFAPAVDAVYPSGQTAQTRVEVPGLSDILCGASRPGHFAGVATVVCKLFNMVQPDLAVFGEKDFQQLLVIRRMIEDLSLPVEIRGVPTVREADGLALSSRNGYLTADERGRAPAVYRALQAARDRLEKGAAVDVVEAAGRDALSRAGLLPDYFSVRRSENLAEPEAAERELVVLAAAYLGKARLIDNLRVSLS